MQTRSIISQLHTAISNPTALLLGGACGALVPLGTCYVTHDLLHGDLLQPSILPLLVLGGLVFSCLSVYAFASSVFGSWYKALGFVICRLAKVPVVCTQGLRGTQSTISIEAVSVEHVAAALGQKGPRITRRAYLAPGAEQSSRARKVEQLIAGAP
jgi:hypothetical protein